MPEEESMSESEQTVGELLATIEKLELELEHRDRLLQIIAHVDDALEEAILHKWPVAKTMSSLLPGALETLGARALFVRTFDEEQRSVDFAYPSDADFEGLDLDAICGAIERDGIYHERGAARDLLGYRLDVTDVYLGSVILATHEHLEPEAVALHQQALEQWSEQVDNYLAAVADARRKHQAMIELSDALRVSILDQGLDRAIHVLKRYVPYKDLALTLKYDANLDMNSVNYRVITESAWHTSSERTSQELRRAVFETLAGDEQGLIARFDLEREREVAQIFAADGVTPVGRVSVGVGDEPLSPFARDVLDRFADYIRQRVVDFNKEWKRLSHNFPQDTVRRLLQEDDYFHRYLAPRERDVAILYCDISGFTRLSEQILAEPELIGKLIDHWGNKVVEFIWEHGGVFDKMVGDCIIGIFGPPFFEESPRQLCRAAADAAKHISEYTRSLANHPDFPEISSSDHVMGVATGLNFCPLFVGTFGPDENFTGFSSGMNNTARLQGVATRDEILCMDSFVQVYGDATRFTEQRSAVVKNVAEPLSYHAFKY
jgi:class 3 adenylate cyclase